MIVHPSSFRLDAIALGEPPDEAVARHLHECSRCAARLVEARRPTPLPPWLNDLARPPRRRLLGEWRLAVALAPALAAVATIGLFALRGPDQVREKGAASVALYLKRGDAVSTWNGRSPLRPGDRLRIGIRGAGYGHVSIAVIPASGGAPAVLYAGPLSERGESLLPISFRVDSPPRKEVLSVIVGDDPVAPAEHVASPPRSRGKRWAIRITLPEESPP